MAGRAGRSGLGARADCPVGSRTAGKSGPPPPETVRRPALRLDFPRRNQEPHPPLVRHADLRQPGQGPPLPAAATGPGWVRREVVIRLGQPTTLRPGVIMSAAQSAGAAVSAAGKSASPAGRAEFQWEDPLLLENQLKIGRASCRERV